ncbi:MAG: hydrogenase maturation protease [Phycisphaerae bacterium]|jgi:hydrogenase maturation protease
MSAITQHPAARTLVLGLGNPLLTDDAVGLRVLEQLRPVLAGRPDLELAEDYWGGLRLMERIVGYERVIIIDAQRTGAPPGTVCVLDTAGPTQHGDSVHDMDLWTALEFGRRAGAELPAAGDIRIVAIEAADVETFGEQCTPAVEAGVPRAAELVQTLLTEWR